MRKKESVISCRPTEKNRIYMEALGIMDGRTGQKRKPGPEASRFINECITIVLEAGVHPLQRNMDGTATADQLRTAYLKFKIARNEREILRLQQESVLMARHMPSEQEYQEAMTQAKK